MMIDISTEMLVFKEAIRHSWNTYFWPNEDRYSDESQESFGEIERALLKVLVLTPHGMEDVASSYRLEPLANILVTPETVPGEMPIQYGKKLKDGNTVWEMPGSIDVDENTQFKFYDIFDWRTFEHIDLPYVRAVSVPRESSEHKISRLALIEHIHCRFLLKLT